MTFWIRRQLNILDFTISSLLRRKGKNISLLCVYTVVIFVAASVIFFTDGMKKEAALLLNDAPDIVVQRLCAGRSEPIPLRHVADIRRIRGVRAVKPRLWGYYYDPVTRGTFTVLATDKATMDSETVTVGQGVARTLDVKKGDMLALNSYQEGMKIFTVEGLFHENSELLSSDLIRMSPSGFRQFFSYDPSAATDIAVIVPNSREVSTVAKRIMEQLPGVRVIQRSEILRTYDAVFDWRSGMLMAMLTGAFLAFVIFAWEKGSGLSAEERKEIGILKGVGWETSDVLSLKMWEGISVSLTAYLAGTTLAYLHVFVFSAPLLEPILKGWSVLYPRFRLTPNVSPYVFFVLFFLTVIPYVAATIIPCWRAATSDPDAVMRG